MPNILALLDHLVDIAAIATSIIVPLILALLALELRARLRRFEGKTYEVTAPAAAGSAAQLLVGLHGLLRPELKRLVAGQPFIALGLHGSGREVSLRIWIPQGHEDFVLGVLRGAYPGVEVTAIDEPALGTRHHAVMRGGLARDELLPIKTRFADEPLAALIAAAAQAREGEEISLNFRVRPKTERWEHRAIARAQQLRDGRAGTRLPLPGVIAGRIWEFERRHATSIEGKATSPGFDCVLEIHAASASRARSNELLRGVMASLAVYAGDNKFAFAAASARRPEDPALPRRFPLFGSFILTAEELAGLWHPPHSALPSLALIRSPKIAPPSGVQRGERLLGMSTWAGENVPVRLSIADSRHHLHLLGATGTGKSTAMLNLAVADITAGRGVAILDPKGDLVEGVLARIPDSRISDVILIGPDDLDRSVGLNPLGLAPGDDQELVAENTLTIFKRIYERFWGMRTDDVLKSSLLTLLRTPDPTLAHIPVLLTDADFRRRITQELHDPLGLDSFWIWFEGLTEGQRGEAIGPVLNKLRDFLIRPRLRHLLCQPRSTVDLRAVVDTGQILLADLNVGRWGQTAAALVGSFLVARLWQAVLARSRIAEDQRRDFYLYIDEFQNFLGVAGPFADALAQARSLRLSLAIANQHLGQLSRELREAVRANARSRLVFQCGHDDAATLAREFAPLDATALLSLARFEAAARLSIAGYTSAPFTLRTLPPAAVPETSLRERIVAASRDRYGAPIADVDAALEAALGKSTAEGDERIGGVARGG
jgi:hypothetical protein